MYLNNFYMNGLLLISPFQSSKIFLKNLVSPSLTTEIRLFSSYINNLYLSSGWISALFRCAAQRRPLAGHRLRPQTEFVILASTVAIWSYVSMCQCVNVYTNLRSISLDYPGQDRLPNWLTKISKPLSWRGESASPPCTVCRAADYAARSPPLGFVLFIF